MERGKPILRVAVEEWVPWTKVIEKNEGSLDILGPMANLLHILSAVLDFEYELVRPSDRIWGGPLPNGSWTGLLGLLQRQDVEMAVGPFGVTNSRETVCDFSVPLYSENNAILMARPPMESDMAGFIKPFTWEVWLLTLVSLFAMVIMMVYVSASEDKIYNGSAMNNSYVTKASIWALKALTQESSEWVPTRNGGRVLVATWLLASLIFMSSYSGILTAMLTVPRVTIPIDSQEDLVTQSHMTWKLEAGSMMYQYYQEATSGLRKAVFDGHSGTFQDCWAARKGISEGDFAAICDRTTMKKAMSWDFSTNGKCHLYISSENVYSNIIIAMAFKINSTYRISANRIIQSVKESGLLDKWLDSEISNTSQCLRPPSSWGREGSIQLDLEAFVGPFLLLAGGLLLGLLAFLTEAIL